MKQVRDTILENPCKSSLPLRVALAKALADMKIGSIHDAALLITDGGMMAPMATIENCQTAKVALEELGNEALNEKLKWVKQTNERYPLGLKADNNLK